MKIILTILSFFLIEYAFCQPKNIGSPQNNISGSIVIPPLQSLEVKTINSNTIQLKNSYDFTNAIEIKSFYTVKIKSNTHWVLSYNATATTFTNASNPALDNIPAELIFIKKSSDDHYSPLTTFPQVILNSNNDDIINEYSLDIKINPSWNYSGGLYNLGIVFTLTNE